MRFLLCSFVPFILLASLHDQTALPNYSVLKTENGDAYLASLNQLADQGYRVVAVSKYTVLRLDAAPPDTYRYLRLEVKGGPAQYTNWINEQGAHGYRWLPRTNLLEKAPHPRNYEYRNSPHGALGPSKNHDLFSVAIEGYHPVGIVAFSHAIGAATFEEYFEREIGQRDASSQKPGFIQIADAMRADAVLKRVSEFAQQGYRFLAPHQSNKGGGIAVMMQRCAEDCHGRYDYRYFDAKDVAQVEHDLNAFGSEGFRVAAAALASRPHLLERDTREKHAYSYRILNPTEAESLQASLNTAGQEGYAPVGFVWHSGVWAAEGFLVLEKEATAAAAPQAGPQSQ
jgi:hypothetical protein